MPDLAVVIPTRDRREALLYTLEALDHHELDGFEVEVHVVDNGSSDGSVDAVEARDALLPVTVHREPRPGPAAARNRGWRAARSPIVLFLGDDMAPADAHLLAGHLRLHWERPEAGVALLGRVEWRPDQEVTSFMHWPEHGGPHFPFDRLTPGPVEPAKNLFTSNVSLKRALLETVGGFDERFPYAAVEDSELGVRLQRSGAILEYRPELWSCTTTRAISAATRAGWKGPARPRRCCTGSGRTVAVRRCPPRARAGFTTRSPGRWPESPPAFHYRDRSSAPPGRSLLPLPTQGATGARTRSFLPCSPGPVGASPERA